VAINDILPLEVARCDASVNQLGT